MKQVVYVRSVHRLQNTVWRVSTLQAHLSRTNIPANCGRFRVFINISEGSQRIGRDRQHAYRIAAGSARELRAALRVAQLWDYVDDSVVESVDGILDSELSLLWGLTKP